MVRKLKESVEVNADTGKDSVYIDGHYYKFGDTRDELWVCDKHLRDIHNELSGTGIEFDCFQGRGLSEDEMTCEICNDDEPCHPIFCISNFYNSFDESKNRKVNGRKRVNEGHTEDGYMGATKWVGDKSHLSLYGKDLSSAIRQDLKDNGITDCTVRTSHGDSVTVTVKGKDSDKIPYSQWRKNNFETDVMDWFNQYGYAPIGNGNYVTYKDYLEYTDAEIEDFARQYYDVNIGNEKEFQINHYYIERNYSDTFTRQFIDKLEKINDILVEFVYDDSNAQVDYFARNIYYHIVVVFQ